MQPATLVLLMCALGPQALGALVLGPPVQWQRSGANRANGTLNAEMTDDEECGGASTNCSGCSDVVQCVRINDKWKKLKTVRCSDDAPYCHGGTCKASIPPPGSCGAPKPVDFTCPEANGYFPDMGSCTRYYLCVNNDAFAMDCLHYPGAVYDQRTSLCVPAGPGECYTLPCSDDKLFMYQTYAPAPWIYAVCISSNPAEALVGTCHHAFAMDPLQGKCVLTCNAVGRFADPRTTDPRAYYECMYVADGRLGAPVLGLCPGMSYFDALRQQCVVTPTTPATSNVPIATVTTPPTPPDTAGAGTLVGPTADTSATPATPSGATAANADAPCCTDEWGHRR